MGGGLISLPRQSCFTGPRLGLVLRAQPDSKGDPTRPDYTATLSLMPSLGACTRSCFVPR
jgi:hypothetical protein